MAGGPAERLGKNVKVKPVLNWRLSQVSRMGMLERFLQCKAVEVIKSPPAHTTDKGDILTLESKGTF